MTLRYLTVVLALAACTRAAEECEGECPDDTPPTCTPDCTNLACGVDPVCGLACGQCTGGRECRAPYKEHYDDDPSSYDDDFTTGMFDAHRVCASEVGGPCADHLECPATFSPGFGIINQTCIPESSGFPGGLCTVPDCADEVVSDPCTDGYDCRVWRRGFSELSACHKLCTSNADCRDGWACDEVCVPRCTATSCRNGTTCGPDGVCVAECVPTDCQQQGLSCGMTTNGCGQPLDCGPCDGPLTGCGNWAIGWSCTDLSPSLCSCSCSAWPGTGAAPAVECELVAAGQVACTCSTGGEPGARLVDSVAISAAGASCAQAQGVFTQSFCGLVTAECFENADCDDANPCTNDTCSVNGVCGHTNNTAACDDGLFCNGTDTCSGGSCAAHAGNPCGAATCDETGNDCGVKFATMSSGAAHTCATTEAGLPYCWGLVPTAGNQTSPLAIDTSGIGSPAFGVLSAGENHTCALTTTGTAYCWGSDAVGQLGNGATTGNQAAPSAVNVSGLGGTPVFSALTAGWMHNCGLVSGAAYCWGSNSAGELGNGSTGGQATSPALVSTTNVTGSTTFAEIGGGVYHTCARMSDGAVYCWGDDQYQQLGNGATATDQNEPVAVDTSAMTGATTFASIAVGGFRTFGITTDGDTYYWGEGADKPTLLDTTALGGADFARVFAGRGLYCGLTADGTAYCWGSDTVGELGNGAGGSSATPGLVDTSTIAGDRRFEVLAPGEDHACGLTTDGLAYCWGSDMYGQLGNGSVTGNKQSPSMVAAPPG